MNSPEQHQEIIIIKRGGEGDHGHHGGAWKIAFADFMTAMMALFLVLWLINAADEETKKAVASYFNPVKLVERNRSEKGLHDVEGVQDEEVPTEPNGKFPEAAAVAEPSEHEVSDVEFFADPFSALDEIAANQEKSETVSLEEGGGRNGNEAVNDAAGGEAFMDPFSPNFWNEEVRNSNASGQLTGRYETEGRGEPSDEELTSAPGFGAGDGIEIPPETAQAEEPEAGPGETAEMTAVETDGEMETAAIDAEVESAIRQYSEIAELEAAIADQEGEMAAELEAEQAEQAEAVEQAAAEMLQQITEQLREALGEDSGIVGELSVSAAGDEILISLTDAFDISMYEVGSAVPSPDLVVALEKIGEVLAEQAGGVRIHGHTDGRPFRSQNYDNWRLSSARAQSAYYMLLRGGLDETRVREISGFADRKLLDEEDPYSHRNRRIEVMVEVPQG